VRGITLPSDPPSGDSHFGGAHSGEVARSVPLAGSEGDRLPLVDLYAAQHGPMCRLAFLLTGSSDVAADVVQDAFVTLHRKWSAVREPEAYLRRVVVNGCRSHFRRRARERDRAAEAAGPEAVDLEADEISDVLAALPHRQRAALVLRYWHGCSEREIADALGCRPGTVGSLVHRGLAALREVIEP
jgi:RNA polymerase sigma-70 factor (sigma-E family)